MTLTEEMPSIGNTETNSELLQKKEVPLDLQQAINDLLRRDVERTAILLKQNDDLRDLVEEISGQLTDEYSYLMVENGLNLDTEMEESIRALIKGKAEAFRDSGELITMLEVEGQELHEKAKRMESLSKDPEKNKLWSTATSAVKNWLKMNATGLKITAGITLALAAGAAALYFNPAWLGYPATQLAKYWAMYGLPDIGGAFGVAQEATAATAEVITENVGAASELVAEKATSVIETLIENAGEIIPDAGSGTATTFPMPELPTIE